MPPNLKVTLCAQAGDVAVSRIGLDLKAAVGVPRIERIEQALPTEESFRPRRVGLLRRGLFGPPGALLVRTGAGGVGSFAVQYARSVGAQVLASAGAANLDFVRGLGAETVFDYAITDCAAQLRDLDVIFDAYGELDARRYLTCLKPGGVFLTTGSGGRSMEELAARYGKRWWLFGGLVDVMRLRRQARREGDRRVSMVFAQPRAEHLQHIARLLESGAVRAQVGQVYALGDIARAFTDGQTGHARGKRVIELDA